MPDFTSGTAIATDSIVPIEAGRRKGIFPLAYYHQADLIKDGYGLNGLGQEEEVADYRWIYDIKVDTDGMKLIQQYLAEDKIEGSPGPLDDKTDLIVYHEKATTLMGLNITCLILLSKAFRARVKEMSGKEDKNPEKWLFDKFVEVYKRDGIDKKYGFELDEDALKKAIAYELSIQDARDDFHKVLTKFMPPFFTPQLSPREALMEVFHSLSDTLRKNKLGEAVWNPAYKPYTPIITDIEEYDAFLKLWQKKKNELEAYIKTMEQTNRFLQQVPIISQLYPDDIAAQIKSVCAALRHVLDYIDVVILGMKVYGELIKLENAFIAGVINGLLELFAGLLDLLAILIGLDDLVERGKILEGLENFFGILFTKPQEIGDAIVAGLYDFLARYSDKNGYERAFHAGEDLLGAIDFVLAVAAAVRLLKKVPPALQKFEQFIAKLQKVKPDVPKTADASALKNAAAREAETKRLLAENLKQAGTDAKYAVEKFKKYGLTLREKKGLFEMTYKEQIIWSGDQKALQTLWRELDRKYSGNVPKWLDEMAEISQLMGTGGNIKYLKIISRKMAKQEEWNSCAAAVIKQLADDFGIKMTEAEVRLLANTTDSGTGYTDMARAIKEIFPDKEVLTKAYFEHLDDNKNFAHMLQDAKNSKFATSVGMDPNRHTIIVDKIAGKKVYIRDPWPLEVDIAYNKGIRGKELENIFKKSKFGVEAVIDLEDFKKSWIDSGNVIFKIN